MAAGQVRRAGAIAKLGVGLSHDFEGASMLAAAPPTAGTVRGGSAPASRVAACVRLSAPLLRLVPSCCWFMLL
jgi:hypothetical protein